MSLAGERAPAWSNALALADALVQHSTSSKARHSARLYQSCWQTDAGIRKAVEGDPDGPPGVVMDLLQGLDSLVHTRGLCRPTLTSEVGMTSSSCMASSTASDELGEGAHKRVGLSTRFRGPCPPVSFTRIGMMADDGHPARRTPTAIASGPAKAPSGMRLDNRIRMKVDKPSSGTGRHRQVRREPWSARAGP